MCAAMLLVISIQEVVVYRIIYMILFLYFVLSFQVMSTNIFTTVVPTKSDSDVIFCLQLPRTF